MKLHYYPETDSLYLELRDVPAADTREIAGGLNADFDESGTLEGHDWSTPRNGVDRRVQSDSQWK